MKPLKRGSTYYAVWNCVAGYCDKHDAPTQHWASLHTGDKREALACIEDLERRLTQEKARASLGVPREPVPSKMTLGEFRDKYLDATKADKAETTHATEAFHLGSLLGYFGRERPVGGLSLDDLDAYKKHRLARIAPRSWNSELATLKSVFAWGLRRDPPLYTKNPFAGVSRVDRGEPTVAKYVSRKALASVVASCKDEYWRNVLVFLYATWARGSELRGLKWSDVRLDLGYIEFRRPKERKAKRVPVTEAVLRVLESARGLAGNSEYVFPGSDGDMMTKDALHHKLQALGDAVGVKLSPHMLRHSGITDALASGAPLFAVQAQAGHTQVTTTQGYVHVDLDAQRGAMERLGVNTLVEASRLPAALPAPTSH